MKVIRLVAALCVTLCAATRANVIVDIYQDQYMDPIQSGYQFPRAPSTNWQARLKCKPQVGLQLR